MKKKVLRMFSVLIIVLMVFSTFTPSKVTAQPVEPNQEVTVDQAVLDEMQTKGSASYWVQFKNDVDLSPAYSMNWSDRGWFVYKTLLAQADATQAPVQKYLLGSKVDYKSYWINNSILVTSSTNSVLNEIMKFSGVESIQARKTYILYEPDTSAALLDNGLNAIEPNLTHVNADDVWALGIDGAGLVVANIDTGVRYSHAALVGQYRGNNGGTFDHNYNWFNPDDLDDNVPRDGNGHGTHTMGTMVGDDGGANQIGIAPGAEWMACAGCPDGGCTDSALLGCGQFIAAPTDLTGNNANPDLRPNAVNNSWGDCGQTYDPWFADVIAGWHAVGTYPIFSNGNSSNCGYSSPPGLNTVGNPARSGDVTGVGSSGEQNGQYASHSNWGPTDNLDIINPVDTFANMKPQVVAPGVSIRSSVPDSDTSYEDGWSGTSMSAPHVTGLVALIWQAAPCLIGDYAATETIIESTAVDMVYDDGSALTPTDFPNFATGWGEIDALAAVNYASGMCAMGTLEGVVTTDGFSPVEGAKIFADNGAGYTKNIYSAANGSYSTGLPEGTYTLTASKYGYQSDTVTGIVITEDATKTQDFVIPQLDMSRVSGYVYDDGVEGLGEHGYPLYSSIQVSTPGFSQTIYTDPFTGYYEIELVEATEHTFTTDPIPGGYDPLVEVVTATGDRYTHDIYVPVDGAVCAAPGYQPDYDIFYSFESSDEGFTSGGVASSWDWGDFTSGPMAGHSGTKGIATNPAGDYNLDEDSWMVSPAIDLSGNGTNSTAIQWWDWMYVESTTSTYDYGWLEVTKDGGTSWTTVWGPEKRQDTVYSQQTALLDPTFNVADFQFRFFFHSDFSVVKTGWYVDDIGLVSIPVPPPTTVFSTNFDADNGGFVASGANSTWAWGAPSATPGPGDPYSPPNVWATNLSGYYNNSEESYITSPVIDLSAYTDLTPTISFMHWYNSESNSFDWGSVEATKDGGETWDVIWQKFGTSVDPWTPKSLQLDPSYAVSNFQFRFHFHSDSSVNSYAGWYIDDVAVTVAEPVTLAAPCVVIPGGVVAGYVMNDNDGSPIVGADVYSDVVETQTFFIPEDPASEGLFWVFHPTTTDPEDVVFTASKNLFGADIETVIVAQDEINQQDFYLGTGQLAFDPTSMEVTMTMGDPAHTETLTISNLGTSDAMFELVEKDEGFELPTVIIPAFEGKLPEDNRPVSMGRAPEAANGSRLQASGDNPFAGLLAGEPAFAIDLSTDSLKYIPDTTLPGTWTDIGPTMTSLFAADFLAGDFTTLYAISYDNNNLYTVDVSTGAYTLVGASTPPGGQSWSGLSGTPDGTLYGLTTDISNSSLVTVDPGTGAVTVLGDLPGLAGGIDLAYNTDDDMIYIVDLITDSLFRVDPSSLATTLVGSLGVAPNYAQGMDYEEESGILYWAAYTTSGELRIIDTTTGASTLVGAFPGGAEVDSLAFGTGGQSDVPWLSEDPISGTVPAADSIEVDVTFDPTGLSQPGDYLAELKIKHDTPYTYSNIPITLHLLASSTYGTFNGTLAGMEACDINPSPLSGAEVNFWQGTTMIGSTTTTATGYYSFALPAGTYDIEFAKDGFVTDYAEEVDLAAQATVTVDKELRLEAPCISVDPTSLEQTQVTDTTTTQTLTIMNTGAGDGVFELFELPIAGIMADQLLQDPSFEAYTPNPYWDEYSATFGTPLCTELDCGLGGGSGPRTGAAWSWFGGAEPGDAGYVSQDVLIIPGTANMTFWVEQAVCGTAGASNYMALMIDSVELWRTDGTDPACGTASYREIVVDVSDFADGDTHEIKFDSVTVGSGNFFLDDVELNLEAGGDVPWLSLDPTAGSVLADSSTDVTVTYDSTGLAEGNYFASIQVKNPPASAINVPVTLHVSSLRFLYLPLILK
jgi:subtilisin family serine protease